MYCPDAVYSVCAQSCPALCNLMNCSPPCSSVHGILQASILEWVVIPSSRGSFQTRDWTHISYISCIGRWFLYHYCHLGSPYNMYIYTSSVQSLSRVQLFVTLWTVSHQAPLSMGFSKQAYCSGLPCPPAGDLSDPGIELEFPASPTLADGFLTSSTTVRQFKY